MYWADDDRKAVIMEGADAHLQRSFEFVAVIPQ